MAKDHYATLQVDREAEQIVITAAYRRLAREYHPDLNKSKDAHEKMVALNIAYEVLSTPEKRREYDATLRASYKSSPPPQAETEKRSAAQSVRPTAYDGSRDRSVGVPVAPDPSEFGIAAGYWQHAEDGAREWEKRKRAVSKNAGYVIVGVCTAIAAVISAYCFFLPLHEDSKQLTSFIWFYALVASSLAVNAVNAVYDSGLRKRTFDPRFNPNPVGYARYAIEYAMYQSKVRDVFISRNGLVHTASYCSGMTSYRTVPDYVAAARGYVRCAHCGHRQVGPRHLPPPFRCTFPSENQRE